VPWRFAPSDVIGSAVLTAQDVSYGEVKTVLLTQFGDDRCSLTLDFQPSGQAPRVSVP
jgi:hypothetical protein